MIVFTSHTKVYLSKMKTITVLSILIFLSCQVEPTFVVTELANPSKTGSGEPFIVRDQDNLILSWIEEQDSVDILYASRYQDNAFESETEIARSPDWFVNWADFPGIASYQDGQHVLSYWLEKSSEGTYDYDVHISLSEDKGESWGLSKIIHNDGVSAEHGFVSTALTDDGMLVVWLDGREMTASHDHGSDHDHGGHGGGSMTLRSAIVSTSGIISNRLQIDNRVCECCQTDVVNASCGPIAVYRNRSEDEVRDVYYSRLINSIWTDPKPLYVDNWKINGCPVNGPRIAAYDQAVSAVWYSQSDDTPKVQLVISDDCAATFSEPILIATGDKVMGRLDIQMNQQSIYVTYMEQDTSWANIMLSEYSHTGQLIRQSQIAQNELSRKSGFPRMVAQENQIFVVFRDVKLDKIQTVKVL